MKFPQHQQQVYLVGGCTRTWGGPVRSVTPSREGLGLCSSMHCQAISEGGWTELNHPKIETRVCVAGRLRYRTACASVILQHASQWTPFTSDLARIRSLCWWLAAGDYWPGEAENALAEIQEQQRKEGKNSKKGPRGKAIKGKRYGQVPPPLPSYR